MTADRAAATAPRAIRVFYANKEVDAFNTDVALQGVHDVREAAAFDSYIGYKSSQECHHAQAKVAALTHTETGNLPRTILLARGKPYMLTFNVDVKDGLVNGAVGVFQEIEHKGGNTNVVALLWIRFDGNTGRLTRFKAKPVIQAACRRRCQELGRVGACRDAHFHRHHRSIDGTCVSTHSVSGCAG